MLNTNNNYIEKLFDLSDRVVVLTGGMGKLGTEFAEALASVGAKVAILDIVDTPNDRLTALAESYPFLFIKTDLTNESDIEKALNIIEDKWGAPTVLINNAGWKASINNPQGAGSSFEEYPMDLWDKVFAINVGAAAKCAKIFGGNMVRKKLNGSIINVVSHYGLVSADQRLYEYREKQGKPKFIKDSCYGASKASLISLTRDLATLWGEKGIRVNAVALGGVESLSSDQEFKDNYSARTPLGRMARPNEYNGAVIFLASEASSYVTGTTLVADGGWTAW